MPGGLAHSYEGTLAVIVCSVTACAAAVGLTARAFSLPHVPAHALTHILPVHGSIARPVVAPLPVAAAAAHALSLVPAFTDGVSRPAACAVNRPAPAHAPAAPRARTIALWPGVIKIRHRMLLFLQLLTYVINRAMGIYGICQ